MVDFVTDSCIVESDLTLFQLMALRKATCAQTEYYIQNGETFNSSGMQSVGIGKFSYTAGGTQSEGDSVSPRARLYLNQAGLMFAGIPRR